MTADQVLDVARQAIFVLIKLGAPIMLVALVVGVAVALLQALTQMQEMTLSFVPERSWRSSWPRCSSCRS